MTHDTGGAAVIAATACAVLVADAVYLTFRWNRLGSGFDRGVVLGACALLLVSLLVRAAGAGRPIGADREAARRQTWRVNGMAGFGIVAVVFSAPLLGRNALLGAVAGEIAALAAGFVAYSASWMLRRRR
jgi:hypothetical protein